MKMQHGFVALSSILIISAVVVAITTSVALLAIGEGQSSLALTKGEETLQFVDGCVEDALMKSQADANYNGGNITRPEGTCVVDPIGKVGNTWTMTVSTTDTLYNRSIQVIFNRTTAITITSWKET